MSGVIAEASKTTWDVQDVVNGRNNDEINRTLNSGNYLKITLYNWTRIPWELQYCVASMFVIEPAITVPPGQATGCLVEQSASNAAMSVDFYYYHRNNALFRVRCIIPSALSGFNNYDDTESRQGWITVSKFGHHSTGKEINLRIQVTQGCGGP